MFGELPGVCGAVPGPAPGLAHGPFHVPRVVAGLLGCLPGPLLLALGLLKPPGQVADALLSLLLLFLRPALLPLCVGQLDFQVVGLLPGFRGLLPGQLQSVLLLAAPGAPGIQIGHLARGLGPADNQGRRGLPGPCREADRGAQRLDQAPLRPLLGRLRVGQHRMQGALDLLPGGIADALPRLGRQLAGLTGSAASGNVRPHQGELA